MRDEVEASMEDLAMNGSAIERKAEKAERKRLRHLENVKKDLNVDDYYNDEPLEASEIEESMLRILKGLKDPLVKTLLGNKVYKDSVNSMIKIINSVATVRVKEDNSLLKAV